MLIFIWENFEVVTSIINSASSGTSAVAIAVDIGIRNFELDNIGLSDIVKKKKSRYRTSLGKNKIQKNIQPATKQARRRVKEVKLRCNTDEHLGRRKLIFHFGELQENHGTRTLVAAAAAATTTSATSKHPDQTATASRTSGLADNICVCTSVCTATPVRRLQYRRC